MASSDPYQHPSTWANPRAEQVLRRLQRIDVPEVSARAMRKRLRGIPAALPPAVDTTGETTIITRSTPKPAEPRGPRSPREQAAVFSTRRDWRWFVGGLGKVLISIGILIFAFVAYQLWGTGIQYARAQSDLKNEFATQLAELPVGTQGPASTLPQLETTVPADPNASVVPDGGAPATSDAPTLAPIELPPLDLGDVLGRIEIPAIGVDDMIVAGVRQSDLDKGVGHYPYTPLPGDTGNAAIAGHRTTHGQPFFNLDKLVPGDDIVVTTLEGRFVYAVTDSKVVDPSDFTVLLGNPAETKLTLTTCHPRYSQKRRLVVSALLKPEESVNTPADITYADDAVAAASNDPTTEDTIVGEATGTTVAGDGSDRPSAAATAATADAFGNGWFSDPDAWPQIAAWGAGLTAVALMATWLGRRSRNWIGALAGIAPFVVLLYFWFENVNRLLPPGL